MRDPYRIPQCDPEFWGHEEWNRPTPRERVMGILLYYHTDLTEFGLAFFALAWGTWLLLFLRGAPALERLAPAWLWGTAFVLLGVAQLAAWITGRHHRRQRLSRVGLFAWALVTLTVASGDPEPLAVPLCATIAILSALAMLHNGGTRQ